jgi:hypothetical protein
MRKLQVYPIIRECHAAVEDEGVREACDRFVQILMRDEAGDEDTNTVDSSVVLSEDEDYKIIDV